MAVLSRVGLSIVTGHDELYRQFPNAQNLAEPFDAGIAHGGVGVQAFSNCIATTACRFLGGNELLLLISFNLRGPRREIGIWICSPGEGTSS